MAELRLNQIEERLDGMFMDDTRTLVFWYDDNADFIDDIDSLELDHAKVYKLEQDNQFYTKYFLECLDLTTNYLIYAPFPKPAVEDNHLEDTLLYSKRFYADRASLICADLGISEKYKYLIKRYIKFFANKDRTQRFYDLDINNYNEQSIPLGLICVLCHVSICTIGNILYTIFAEDDLENNSYLDEIEKFGLTEAFWEFCKEEFGYFDSEPTLEKLLITLFVTYADKYIQANLPQTWQRFISRKSGNAIAFLNEFMNNTVYWKTFDRLSNYVANSLNVQNVLSALHPEDLIDCDAFQVIDQIIITWITDQLLAENIGAQLNSLSIPKICDMRKEMHFGRQIKDNYQLLESAFYLVGIASYKCPTDFMQIVRIYQENDYKIDQQYRWFYSAFDMLGEPDQFEPLQELIENIYANEYLTKLLPAWNKGIQESDSLNALPLERNFYNDFVKPAKERERTVVIISDAMRYEVGQELFLQEEDDPKSTVRMEAMLSVLPSYTQLGMAALLPHQTLKLMNDGTVLVDDMVCNKLESRQSVLQRYCSKSKCIQFDDLKSLKKQEFRDVFTGQDLIYIYHNQIDARGDKPSTEDEVFTACEEAISEIRDLIRRISNNANTHRFLVTADHGFIYKHDKLTESDKISDIDSQDAHINRRYIISSDQIIGDGIQSINLGDALDCDDELYVSFPISSNVFKVSGGGQNYVHGGSSPQEMLIPVLDIKMDKSRVETTLAKITLISSLNKITNLITSVEVIQSDAVSDTVRAATYRLGFISENGEKISDENTVIANSREDEAADRITRLQFRFKNQSYDKSKEYYLVAYNDATGVEAWRQPVIMDLAFSDDYDW